MILFVAKMREVSYIFSTKNVSVFEILTFEILTTRTKSTKMTTENIGSTPPICDTTVAVL